MFSLIAPSKASMTASTQNLKTRVLKSQAVLSAAVKCSRICGSLNQLIPELMLSYCIQPCRFQLVLLCTLEQPFLFDCKSSCTETAWPRSASRYNAQVTAFGSSRLHIMKHAYAIKSATTPLSYAMPQAYNCLAHSSKQSV